MRHELRPALRAVAERNGGPFTRRDAAACGYSERELKTLTGHAGAWVVLRRGVYVERELYDTGDDDDRYALQVRAVGLTSTAGGAFSHGSAAVVLGLPVRPRWRAMVHLTRPDAHGGRGEGGVSHHKAVLDPDQVVTLGGLPVTGLARTGADLARLHGFEDGVVAFDAALRRGATREELAAVCTQMHSWPGVGAVRAAADFADGKADGVGESVMRVVIGEAGIGPIETQYVVEENGRVAWVDCRVGRHLFEFDGRVKYVGRESGGVADRPVEQVVWEEKQREDWLRRAGGGHGMSRVVWSDLFGAARRRTRQRLRAEYDETVRRLGDGG